MNISNITHRKNAYCMYMLFVIVNFCILYGMSCEKQQDISQNTVKNMTVSSDEDTQLSITDAYIMPDPIDEILLNTIPQTVKDRNDTKKNVKKIRTLINPEIELYKYLQRKREYAKTSIFDDIP